MIEPALSAEEWAKAREDAAWMNECEQDDDKKVPVELAFWEAGKLVIRGDYAGCECCSCFEMTRLQMAALCLHGRITWEMVDTLRRTWPDVSPTDSDILEGLADLLESMQPPRAP